MAPFDSAKQNYYPKPETDFETKNWQPTGIGINNSKSILIVNFSFTHIPLHIYHNKIL